MGGCWRRRSRKSKDSLGHGLDWARCCDLRTKTPRRNPQLCHAGSGSLSRPVRDRLLASVSFLNSVDLGVQVGVLRLANPIVAASGTFGYGLEFAHLVNLNALGGFVTKGISLEPIEGAPAPRLCETASGMLNAVGLQNVGVQSFVKDKLPLLRKYNTHLIVNVFGYALDDYVEVIRRLEDAEGISGYELNISCPNVKRGGIQFGSNPELVGEVVEAARKAAS